jgi:hypothetical protein
MYARAIDDAAARLHDLRREEWEDLGLAGLAISSALAATQVYPELALPLFLGGLGVGILGIRALWRHWDLVDRLLDQPAAYVIPEVRTRAERESTMERRQALAGYVRVWLKEPVDERLATVADELEALAADLVDDELALDPACAVACTRLLADLVSSPLLNRELPQDVLRGQVLRIRSGFTRRPPGE